MLLRRASPLNILYSFSQKKLCWSFRPPCEEFSSCQRKVWNTRVFRLFVRGMFLVENFISLKKLEQLPTLKKGNQPVARLFPWRFQKDEEQRWKFSMLTKNWPGPHWETRTRITEKAKPQVWGETPWNTDSPGLRDGPLSQVIPASSAIPMPLTLQSALRHTSSRTSLSVYLSRMATRRGTAPLRSNSSCCLAEEKKKHSILMWATWVIWFVKC